MKTCLENLENLKKDKIVCFSARGNAIEKKVRRLGDEWLENFDESLFNGDFLKNELTDWAASGAAGVAAPAFNDFIVSEEFRRKITQLILLERKGLGDESTLKRIMDIDLWGELDSFMKERDDSRPILYVRRLQTILFPNISTTIANEGSLVSTAELLGINEVKGFNYEELQYQVRSKSDSFLKEIGIYEGLSLYAKCVIPWFAYEASLK